MRITSTAVGDPAGDPDRERVEPQHAISILRGHVESEIDAARRHSLQAEYDVWREQLPESLADSRTAELLEGVCDVDLDALDVELPRGFGRD